MDGVPNKLATQATSPTVVLDRLYYRSLVYPTTGFLCAFV